MKWYKRDPTAALEGMLGLTGEERGYYNTLIDLLYARDGNGVTDELVVCAMGERPQVWRRVKASLIAKGKVRETAGKLTANRVETELKLAGNRMVSKSGRWENKDLLPDISSLQPQPQPQPDNKDKKRKKENRPVLVSLPDDWQPKGPQRDPTEAEEFRDKARAKGWTYANWDAAYRNFQRSEFNIRNKSDYRPPNGKGQPIDEALLAEHRRQCLERPRNGEEDRLG